MIPAEGRYDADRYFEMIECGIVAPDDNVELLEGLIVAMPSSSPPHEVGVAMVQYALQRKLGLEVFVRVQMSFLAGKNSVPQPDVAVVDGRPWDYTVRPPSKAHLLVEVSRSSLTMDRLTKAPIYARAGVPCYWIVNLRNRCVEVYREPDRWKAKYAVVETRTGSDLLTLDAFPGVTFTAEELLPPELGESVPEPEPDDWPVG